MKPLFILLFIVIFCGCANAQKTDSLKINYDWSDYTTCLVAHMTKDGGFTCDYRGHYFPFEIYDSTIKKWFVRVEKNGDSLYYYRHPDITRLYFWSKVLNGYADNPEGWGMLIGGPYTGSDTLKITEQDWQPYPPKK